jgi:hypothetical protein
MKIIELQTKIKDALNAVQDLIQGGCKAFAEDTRTVYEEAKAWINNGKVAVVVVTPNMKRNGCAATGIPSDTRLLVQCSELAPLAAKQKGVIRALDAAEIVMLALDGEQFCWQETTQTIDRKTLVITATVVFETSIILN